MVKVDGVFSGGGMKGFALTGAYQILEEKGLQFERVAGTSAGAILAGFSVAGYTAKEIIKIMSETKFETLLDSRKTFLPIAKWLLLYWRLGLYKGDAMEQWIEKNLAVKGVYTFSDLPEGSLRVIASDLSNGRILILPDDLDDYGIPRDSFPVAKAIRMSCSIPYFFEPVKLRSIAGTSVITDGGVLSNFPIWIFDREEEKQKRPIVGIQLSHHIQEKPKRLIKNGIQLFEALFITMKDAHDARYISRKQEKNIIFIPTDGIQATEFELSEEKKDALLQLGREKAAAFLKKWTY